MPPPDLPADRPVADLDEPAGVHLFPAGRVEAEFPFAHLLPAVLPLLEAAPPERPVGQRAHPHEPLVGEAVLDGDAGALGAPERHPAVGHRFQQPGGVERGHRLVPRPVAVETPEGLGNEVVQGGVVPHHIHRGEAVPLPDLEVVRVVGGGDLQAAGAELPVHALVGDHRDLAVGERQPDALPHEGPVPRVLRVHRDRHIAEERLRAGGGHREPRPRVVGERVGDAPEVPRLPFGGGLDLVVGERGAVHRAPVHHPLAPVDEAPVVEGGEDGAHRPGEALVHGEPGAAEVAGTAQFPQLLQDDPAVALAPFPDLLDERLAAEGAVVHALGVEVLAHHRLGGDPGVVGARHPERVPAGHPPVADHHILDGVVQGVAHVEPAGDVRRRDDHGERPLAGVAAGPVGAVRFDFGLEGAGVVPLPPGRLLDGLRVEPRGQGRPGFRRCRRSRPAAGGALFRGAHPASHSRSRRRPGDPPPPFPPVSGRRPGRCPPPGRCAPRGRCPGRARSGRRWRSGGSGAAAGRGVR